MKDGPTGARPRSRVQRVARNLHFVRSKDHKDGSKYNELPPLAHYVLTAINRQRKAIQKTNKITFLPGDNVDNKDYEGSPDSDSDDMRRATETALKLLGKASSVSRPLRWELFRPEGLPFADFVARFT